MRKAQIKSIFLSLCLFCLMIVVSCPLSYASQSSLEKISEHFDLGMNYYPQNKLWDKFWLQYDAREVERDLRWLRASGFSSVRIFVPHSLFVDKQYERQCVNHLKLFLRSAQTHQLAVTITLFDWLKPYTEDLNLECEVFLESFIPQFKNNKALAVWDVKNEPDLDYQFYRSDKTVDGWLKRTIDKIKQLDPKRKITVGWFRAPDTRSEVYPMTDFLCIHHYRSLDALRQSLSRLNKQFEKPIYVQELGYATRESGSESEQKNYILNAIMDSIIYKADGLYLWTLYDHTYEGKHTIRDKEKYFGLFAQKHVKKISADIFSKPFLSRLVGQNDLEILFYAAKAGELELTTDKTDLNPGVVLYQGKVSEPGIYRILMEGKGQYALSQLTLQSDCVAYLNGVDAKKRQALLLF